MVDPFRAAGAPLLGDYPGGVERLPPRL